MQPNASSRTLLVAFAFFACLITPEKAPAVITEMMKVGAAVIELNKRVDDLQGRIQDTSDYIAGSAIVGAKSVIDHAEAAYQRQMDKTLREVGGLLFEKLRNVEALLDLTDQKVEKRLAQVEGLENRIAQVFADTILAEDGPYVQRVKPTILTPGKDPLYQIRVTGVDLNSIGLRPCGWRVFTET